MSSFLPGQHPALLPQLLYDSSSPSLWFLPSRPLALTSGRARGSLRVAASKLCICWLTCQTDKGEAHPADIPPGRMWMGVSLPCSATIFIKGEKKSRNLVSLRAFICLSYWNEISQRAKCSVSVTYGQRWGCTRNQAEIGKNWEAQLGKPLPLHKFSQPPNDWLEWDLRSEFSSTAWPCCPLVLFLWTNWVFVHKLLPQELLEFAFMA